MSLGAAFFFAGYLLLTERVREEMDTLTFSSLAIVGSVATLFITCLLGGAALGHLPATIIAVSLLAQVPLTALLAARGEVNHAVLDWRDGGDARDLYGYIPADGRLTNTMASDTNLP